MRKGRPCARRTETQDLKKKGSEAQLLLRKPFAIGGHMQHFRSRQLIYSVSYSAHLLAN
jgi:hypothetical protein